MDVSEGTGERRASGERGVVGSVGDLEGRGAEIPKALTSFARRWGGMGERGRGQEGRLEEAELGSDASRRWTDASSEVISREWARPSTKV